MTLPFDMIMMRSATHSAYSMLWVVIRTVWVCLRARMSFQVCSRTLASIPVVGQSRITNFGSPTRLRARDNLLLIPPEKVLTRPVAFRSKLTLASLRKISYLSKDNPLRRWKSYMCSSAVSYSQRISNCGQTPISLRIAVISCSTYTPPILAYPLVFAKAPIRMFINVDFPAPFSPKRATISPLESCAVTPVNAQTLLSYIFCRFVMLTKTSFSYFSIYPEFLRFLCIGSRDQLYPLFDSTSLSSSQSIIRKEKEVIVKQSADQNGDGRMQVCSKGFLQVFDW